MEVTFLFWLNLVVNPYGLFFIAIVIANKSAIIVAECYLHLHIISFYFKYA
jgi:hypothetical protein